MKQKLKVLMMGILFTLFTQSAFAIDVYVGGALGVGSFDGRTSITNSLLPENHYANHGGTSFIGGGLLGAETIMCNGIYAAGELNALYNSHNFRARRFATGAGIISTKINNDFLYGADFKLGYDWNCVLPYVVVGVSAAKFRTHLSNPGTGTVFGIPAGSSSSFSKTRYGTKVGFGVRFGVWECLDMDLQYSYTWFGSQSRSFIVPVTGGPTTSWRFITRHDQHRFLVSLNMPFYTL